MLALLTELLDLVLPRACAGCDAGGSALCEACLGTLRAPAVGAVSPTPCPAGLPALTAALPYEGVAQRLLLAHKEHGALQLTPHLGAALSSAVLCHPLRGPVVLCPVPSSRRAVRRRGHDHAMRLAGAAAAVLRRRGIDAEAQRLLLPARVVADQSGLTAAQRAANLQGALRARPGGGLAVVVVDDVVTTGATVVEAARALRAAGHEVLGAAAVAATTRRHASPAR